MEYTTSLVLDVACKIPLPRISEKQLDNGTRIVNVTLKDSETNTAVTLTGEETFEIRVQRADGVLITGNAEYSDGVIVITLTSDMLGFPGRAKADVRVISGEDILSAGFLIDVQSLAQGDHSSGTSGDIANLRIMTKAEWDALEGKPNNQITYVTQPDGSIKQYLGETEVSGGGGSEPYVIEIKRKSGQWVTTQYGWEIESAFNKDKSSIIFKIDGVGSDIALYADVYIKDLTFYEIAPTNTLYIDGTITYDASREYQSNKLNVDNFRVGVNKSSYNVSVIFNEFTITK